MSAMAFHEAGRSQVGFFSWTKFFLSQPSRRITEAGTASPLSIINPEVPRRREHRGEGLLQFPPTARTPQ